jgi:tetratricopeptide (TPR) repeat protein
MFTTFKQPKFHVFVILTITTIVYLPVFNNSLTNWDDILYVLYNPYLKNFSFENIKNIFSNYYAGNYHPLTLISMAVDFQLGGTQPWPYQLTNLILHLANTFLVYLFVRSLLRLHTLTAKRFSIIPLVVAALFGIHTMQVESVAWISERKNVLYAFFFLASLQLYILYLKHRLRRFYFLSLLLFAFSLLSKGMAMPLSVCLLVIDYFAGRRLISKRVVLEKLPFFILSIAFGIIAIMAQHSSESIRVENSFEWYDQIAFASYGFIQYLVKLIYPYNLSAYYPYPVKVGSPVLLKYYVYIVLVCILFLIFRQLFRRNKLVIFGSLFFIANISIVIQLLPIGDAFMADRYIYIPSIGIFLILAYWSSLLLEKKRIWQYSYIIILVGYATVIGFKTHNRIGIWKDSLTLWNDAIKKYPVNNDRGYQNRGNIYFDMGRYYDALDDYMLLLQIDPLNSGGYIGMARIKQVMNDMQGALADFNTALSLRKTYEGFIDRGVLKINLADYNGALADMDSAYQIDPHRTGAVINSGYVYYLIGKYREALQKYSHAIQMNPLNSKAYIGRAKIKQEMNDLQGALSDFNTSLSLQESYDGYLNRAICRIKMTDYEAAIVDLNACIQLQQTGPAFYYRGIANFGLGRKPEACADFRQAVLLGNSDAETEIQKNCK